MITKTGIPGDPIRYGMVLAVFLLTMITGEGIAGNLLTSVAVQPSTLNAARNDTVRLSWKLMDPGVIDAFICDLNGRIVRTFLKRVDSKHGTHEAIWDGRDDAGRLCPTGAYFPIIKVRTRQKGIGIYNPTVSPWGLKLAADENGYDDQNGLIRYRLSQSALCQVRVGEKDGGPCYKSIFAWEPKARGSHTVAWDGKDASGLKDVWKSEQFQIFVDAFTLPEDAILLSGCDPRTYDYSTLKKRFPITPPRGRNVSLHALHQRELCHDMTTRARFLTEKLSTTKAPDLSGQVSLQVSAGRDVDSVQLDREKIELYVFVDGKMLFEGPQPTLPATVTVDTTSISNGRHFFTINLRTFEDHLGTCSLWANVRN